MADEAICARTVEAPRSVNTADRSHGAKLAKVHLYVFTERSRHAAKNVKAAGCVHMAKKKEIAEIVIHLRFVHITEKKVSVKNAIKELIKNI